MNAVAVREWPQPPLSDDKTRLLAALVEGLGATELYAAAAWIAAQASVPAQVAPSASAGARLTIVYGSQTGNAKRVAEQLARRSEAAGLPVRLLRADAYPQRELAQESHLVVVISTQGDAEPPDDARGLVEFLAGRRAPRLAALKYAVLALGDTSYPEFCAIGRQVDARLAELGGTRFAPLGEADVDLEAVAEPWSVQALERAREALKSTASPSRAPSLHAVAPTPTHDREHPFHASVLASQRIVSRGSEREVRHIELSLEGSGLRYAPGDSLGVWPRNPRELVTQWLEVLGLDGDQAVTHAGRTLPLAQWLGQDRELTRLSRGWLVAHADASGADELAQVLQPERSAEFAALLESQQPIDLLRRYPAPWPADALVAALRPLTPRLYSIASSPKAVGEEVHLTVAVVDYQAHGERHWGAASSFLAAVEEDGTVPVFIEANERFRLPVDPSRDVIMIGPGTGVAPFRAFLQERRESDASGRNWLFFGNRHFAQDFLYQVEWQEALKAGALHRLDLAFSRDGDGAALVRNLHKDVQGLAPDTQKNYVQQRLREQGRELYDWLEGGAHLYVCGDARHMAKDVHVALLDVAVAHGGRTPDQAREWLADLLQQGRYARDVY